MTESCSVLIVDDNDSLSRTMSFVLRRRGFDVTLAKDGLEAIEQVAAHPFDVILMDIKMPRLNGVETYRRIKRVHPDVLVVMMTAYAVEDQIQTALEEGAYGVVYKPLDLEQVVALIDRALHADNTASVLVVDDQESTRVTLRNILARRGCRVSTAGNGEEAIEKATRSAYDLIFLDMKLPTIDGLQTCLTLRRICPETTIALMTAYREEMADRVRQALQARATSCIFKPLDLERVIAMVDDVWHRKQRARPQG